MGIELKQQKGGRNCVCSRAATQEGQHETINCPNHNLTLLDPGIRKLIVAALCTLRRRLAKVNPRKCNPLFPSCQFPLQTIVFDVSLVEDFCKRLIAILFLYISKYTLYFL